MCYNSDVGFGFVFVFLNKMYGIMKCKGWYLIRIKCVWEKFLNKYDKYIKENKVNIFICVFYYMYSWNVNKL